MRVCPTPQKCLLGGRDAPTEKPAPVFYLSLDVEATGPFPGLYSLVSIGGLPVWPPDAEHPEWWVDPSNSYYCEIKPLPEGGILPAAMEVHGLSLEHLENHGREPAEALEDFLAYLTRLRARIPKFMMAAWPASFDLPFIGYYSQRFLGHNPFGYNALDIASLAQGLFRCERRQLRSKLARRGLFRPPKPYPHNALDDAQDQAHLLAGLLNLGSR